MSNFICEHCGALICDSPTGYVSGCQHYPLDGIEITDGIKSIQIDYKSDNVLFVSVPNEWGDTNVSLFYSSDGYNGVVIQDTKFNVIGHVKFIDYKGWDVYAYTVFKEEIHIVLKKEDDK